MTRWESPEQYAAPVERDPDQAYYWTPEWQAGERQALREIRAGRVRRFDTADDAIAWLSRPTPDYRPLLILAVLVILAWRYRRVH